LLPRPRHPLHLGMAGLVVVTPAVMWAERGAFPGPCGPQLWASEAHSCATLGATSDAKGVSHKTWRKTGPASHV
jgi:hypothetical protein